MSNPKKSNKGFNGTSSINTEIGQIPYIRLFNGFKTEYHGLKVINTFGYEEIEDIKIIGAAFQYTIRCENGQVIRGSALTPCLFQNFNLKTKQNEWNIKTIGQIYQEWKQYHNLKANDRKGIIPPHMVIVATNRSNSFIDISDYSPECEKAYFCGVFNAKGKYEYNSNNTIKNGILKIKNGGVARRIQDYLSISKIIHSCKKSHNNKDKKGHYTELSTFHINGVVMNELIEKNWVKPRDEFLGIDMAIIDHPKLDVSAHYITGLFDGKAHNGDGSKAIYTFTSQYMSPLAGIRNLLQKHGIISSERYNDNIRVSVTGEHWYDKTYDLLHKCKCQTTNVKESIRCSQNYFYIVDDKKRDETKFLKHNHDNLISTNNKIASIDIDSYPEDVFNMKVKGSNSYIANGFPVKGM